MGKAPLGPSKPSREPWPPATVSTATRPAAIRASPAARASRAACWSASVRGRTDHRGGLDPGVGRRCFLLCHVLGHQPVHQGQVKTPELPAQAFAAGFVQPAPEPEPHGPDRGEPRVAGQGLYQQVWSRFPSRIVSTPAGARCSNPRAARFSRPGAALSRPDPALQIQPPGPRPSGFSRPDPALQIFTPTHPESETSSGKSISPVKSLSPT